MASSALAGPSGAMTSRKVMAISSVADCGKEEIPDSEIPEVEADGNPLTLRIGRNKFATQNGSIVGAIVMTAIWFCFMATLALIRAWLEDSKWQRGFRKLGIPGTLAVPAFTLCPVAVNSVGAMIQRRNENDAASSGLNMAMIVVGLLIGAVVPTAAMIWIAWEVRKHEIFEHVYEEIEKLTKKKKKKKTEEDDDDDTPVWMQRFEWLTEPMWKYRLSRFSQAFGPAFDAVKNPIYIVVSYLILVGAEFAEGYVSLCGPNEQLCCKAGILAISILSFLDLFLLFLFCMPFLVRCETLFLPICSLLGVVCSVLNLVQYFSNFDAEGRLKHLGNPALLVDFTDALVLLTEISFYAATICGLLGVANEVVCGVFDLIGILKEREKREAKKKKNSNDGKNKGVALEQLMMEDAGTKKKNNNKNQQREEADVEMKSVSKEKSRRTKRFEELDAFEEELLMQNQALQNNQTDNDNSKPNTTKKKIKKREKKLEKESLLLLL